jgi:hypothetical protein
MVFAGLACQIGVTQPLVPAKSTYSGLFCETNSLWRQSSGLLSLRTTTGSRYSARLFVGPDRYSFTSSFDATGYSSAQVLRYGVEPLTIELQLDPGNSDLIYGTVTDGEWVAQLFADRAVFDRKHNGSPDAGQYTMIVPGDLGSNESPAGDSYGTITIDRAGRLRFFGIMADGHRVTQGTTVSKGGQWPLYVPVYAGYGSLHGWMLFNGSAEEDLTGDITWIKPDFSDWYYPDGFAITVFSWGSRYQRPPKATRIVDLPVGWAEFNGGGLSPGVTNSITLDERNRVFTSSANPLVMKFSTSNGLFSGRVLHPVSWDWISFRGVVLQRYAVAAGHFLGSNESGEVWIQAP